MAFVPCGHGGFSFLVWAASGGRRVEGMRGERFEEIKQGLSFERWLLCPAGTGAFFYFSLGRLRGGRRGYARRALRKKQSRVCPLRISFCALRARGLFFILVWAASGVGKAGPVMGLRPLLGPPCIPPEAPRLGFPVSVIPRGLRGFCSGSFLAALGDLPPRRAMPACAFALREKPKAICLPAACAT